MAAMPCQVPSTPVAVIDWASGDPVAVNELKSKAENEYVEQFAPPVVVFVVEPLSTARIQVPFAVAGAVSAAASRE